jgi:hypothetical protein
MINCVLSSKVEVGCPIGLTEDYGLFDKFYEDVQSVKKKLGHFHGIWIQINASCQLMLVTLQN